MLSSMLAYKNLCDMMCDSKLSVFRGRIALLGQNKLFENVNL